MSVPLEELLRIYEEQVDQNDDSNICLKIGDRVNPHFGGPQILAIDNTAA